MLKIGDKTFLNLQEAVGWLMENNCIPFQCTAPYAANTEIGLGTIVNPSPAKVRIGSIIFFSDSKVSTVTGITQNGFIVSDQYNNLVDDVAYVQNVSIDASGHLICTLSTGEEIDAGIVKQVSAFSIDASQHLIATFNDGTTQDLGAIFAGNINISGNLNVTGSINGVLNPSVKPLYWHSVTLKRVDGPDDNPTLQFYYDFVVINNDSTPFTLASFMTWLGNNPSAEIKVVQGYNFNFAAGLVSWFRYTSPTTITSHVIKLTTGEDVTYNQNVATSTLSDAVNKLN